MQYGVDRGGGGCGVCTSRASVAMAQKENLVSTSPEEHKPTHGSDYSASSLLRLVGVAVSVGVVMESRQWISVTLNLTVM